MNEVETRCWQLYVRGQHAWQISAECEQPPAWVDDTLRQSLLKHAAPSVEVQRGHVQKLLDELNEIRQAAWIGWQRSLLDKVKSVEKDTSGGTQSGKTESTNTTEAQAGDSPFLRILIDCNRRESALRGIERPNRLLIQTPHAKVDIDTLIEQLEEANRGFDA